MGLGPVRILKYKFASCDHEIMDYHYLIEQVKQAAARGCGRLDSSDDGAFFGGSRRVVLACSSCPSRRRFRDRHYKSIRKLFVDVLSVEHAREERTNTPAETACSAYPMFSDSAKSGWENLTFVYDKGT